MNFALLICTYNRKKSLKTLLDSVRKQSIYPNEIIIVDGSQNDLTQNFLKTSNYLNLKYFKVGSEHRGLTKQRNYAISNIANHTDVVCFLDDDIVLTKDYFKNLLETYTLRPDAIGVGGYIIEKVGWHKLHYPAKYEEFEIDGWVRNIGPRNLLRKKFKLLSNKAPGFMPEFSNGLSISFLPPSGNIFNVEYFMGGAASYRFSLLREIKFSEYFIGYGLYEDLDFCIRASELGNLYVNTSAKLYHHHDSSGRPNRFKYGKMVIRNGWYVWRLKYPNPSFEGIFKWYSISFLLTLVRLGNVLTTKEKKEALSESLGRIVGWLSLYINQPKVER
jgi:GT2 family glycosyltransferase